MDPHPVILLATSPLDGAMVVWFALTGVSLLILSIDLATNSPVSWVQKLAWWLVVLYTGPVGLIAFLLACRRPFAGGHDRFTRPAWKQGVNSEVHCLAGDATGIVIAAVIASLAGLAAGWEVALEYAAGFVSGLFVFQALMMRGMFQGRYLLAVRRTVFAETVSMNFVMLGMLPTMVLLAEAWPESREPTAASFWFRMSLASIAGAITAYPINHWLVAKGLKHGCMTLPGADSTSEPAMAMSHRSPEGASAHDHHHAMPEHGEHGHDHDGGMAGHEAHQHAEHSGHSGHSRHSGHSGHVATEANSADLAHGEGHAHHEMARLPIGVATAWVVGTSIMLAGVMAVVARFVPLPFG